MTEEPIYLGIRDNAFKDFVKQMLKNVPKKYLSYLLTDKSFSYFSTAFTHPSADSENNFEYFKLIGLTTYQKIILWYLYRELPDIFIKKGQEIMTDIKKDVLSRKLIAVYAQTFNGWDYITIDQTVRNNATQLQKLEILQQACDAFYGTVEFLLDQMMIGIGYGILYDCVSQFLSTESLEQYKTIDTQTKVLKDSKTMLQELFFHKYKRFTKQQYTYTIGEVKYEGTKNPDEDFFTVEVKQVFPNQTTNTIGIGKAKIKKEAEKEAAKQALDNFEKTKTVMLYGYYEKRVIPYKI